MSETFALGGFLERWSPWVLHDLSGSEAATLTLSVLLEMAGSEDRRRWQELSFGYTDPRGAVWLRRAIAERYDNLDDAHIVCCAGAQEALTSVMRALLAPGDHAAVVVPIYQPTERAVTSICAATGVPLEDRGAWSLDVDRVAAALRDNTRLVLMNFPNSPTNASIDHTTLAALVALCRRHGLWLVNDEVYGLVDLDPSLRSPRVGDIYERGVSINAVSKGFGLPGLRVGWVACQDRRLLAEVQLAKSMLTSCLAAPSEVLAHVALRAEARIVERNRAVLTRTVGFWNCSSADISKLSRGRRPATQRLSIHATGVPKVPTGLQSSSPARPAFYCFLRVSGNRRWRRRREIGCGSALAVSGWAQRCRR